MSPVRTPALSASSPASNDPWQRVCVCGRFGLEDWLVPVLYQQKEVDLSFAARAREAVEEPRPQLMDLGDEPDSHAFVGRDGAILQLERAMRRAPAAILVHGLGGVGKTTLARGFVRCVIA